MKLDKIILFGDSITQQSWTQDFGFNLAPALQNDYSCKLDIVVRGFCGYNTELAKHLLKDILDEEGAANGKIKLMTIFFGTNDASSGNNAVSVDRYKENLGEIIAKVKCFGIKIIVIGPTLHEDVLKTGLRSSETNLNYSKAAQEVSVVHGVPFIDLWSPFAAVAGWKSGSPCPSKNLHNLLTDGTHFNRLGYEILYSLLKASISLNYPELDSDTLPWLVAPHAEILESDDIRAALNTWRPNQ